MRVKESKVSTTGFEDDRGERKKKEAGRVNTTVQDHKKGKKRQKRKKNRMRQWEKNHVRGQTWKQKKKS